MASKGIIQCVLGTLLGLSKKGGKGVSDSDVAGYLGNDIHAQVKYGQASQMGDVLGPELLPDFQLNNSVLADMVNTFEDSGLGAMLPIRTLYGFARPKDILPKEILTPFESILKSHFLSDDFGDINAFKRTVSPKINSIAAVARGHLESAGASKVKLDYFDDMVQLFSNGKTTYGFDLFAAPGTNTDRDFLKVARNLTGNTIALSPNIIMGNLFEYSKIPAVLLKKQGPEGLKALIKGTLRFAKVTKLNPLKTFARIPELEAINGVYSTSTIKTLQKVKGDFEGRGKFTKAKEFADRINGRMIELTETPLRGIAYYSGEALSPGKGLELLGDSAFVYQPWDMPFMFAGSDKAPITALARFTLEGTKMYVGMYTGLLDGVLSGDAKKATNNAMALTAYSLMLSAQGGLQSGIPGGGAVWSLLPKDVKEDIKQIDEESPGLDILGKFFGLDSAKLSRPLNSIPGIGIPIQILAAESESTLRDFKKSIKEMSAGNITNGVTRLLDASLGLAQVGSIPGVNSRTKRAVKEVSRALREEIEGTHGDVLLNLQARLLSNVAGFKPERSELLTGGQVKRDSTGVNKKKGRRRRTGAARRRLRGS